MAKGRLETRILALEGRADKDQAGGPQSIALPLPTPQDYTEWKTSIERGREMGHEEAIHWQHRQWDIPEGSSFCPTAAGVLVGYGGRYIGRWIQDERRVALFGENTTT